MSAFESGPIWVERLAAKALVSNAQFLSGCFSLNV